MSTIINLALAIRRTGLKKGAVLRPLSAYKWYITLTIVLVCQRFHFDVYNLARSASDKYRSPISVWLR